ncbi:MAG: insulinase family protein [Sphingobacteriales bacterium]|nr:MAG: insulinase family protein [Sphingobacteriales bacterium]TAF83788.1 MAG: insulinase family protein [Sphingobacteriales bacterium]
MLDRLNPPPFKEIKNINFIKNQKRLLTNNIPVFVLNAGEQELVRIEFIFKNVNWDANNPLLASATNALLNDGTKNMSGAQIAETIDFYGAFMQTEYNYDYSAITLFTLNKYAANTLPIIKDVLCNSVFPTKELNTFITNNQQKLKVSLEKNDFLARQKFNNLLFGNNIYGYKTQATDYDKLKTNDILAYFKTAYHPQNCTIFVSGKVDETLFNTLQSLFGDWYSNDTFSENKLVSSPNAQKYVEIKKPNALQSAIRIGQPSINRNHPDFAAMQVLNTVFGGYFGSRLMANIREDKGYTYGISSGNVTLAQAGFFVIATEVGVNFTEDTLSQIKAELNRLKTELIPNEELQLVKNYLMGSLLGSLENAFSHADKFKNIYFYGLDYQYYDNFIHTVNTITSLDLKNIANKYWDWDNFYKVIIG